MAAEEETGTLSSVFLSEGPFNSSILSHTLFVRAHLSDKCCHDQPEHGHFHYINRSCVSRELDDRLPAGWALGDQAPALDRV